MSREKVDLDQLGWKGTMEPLESDGPFKAVILNVTADGGRKFGIVVRAGDSVIYGRRAGWETSSQDISRNHGEFHFSGHFVEYRHLSGNMGAVAPRPCESTVGVTSIRLGEPHSLLPLSDLPLCHLPPTLPRRGVLATRVTDDFGYAYALLPGSCVYPLLKRLSYLDIDEDYKVQIGEFLK